MSLRVKVNVVRARGIVPFTMARIDYYSILGVSRESSEEDIKKAYRRLVFQHHPDRNPDSAHAEAKIREINSAYEVIGDAERRKTYDRLHWGDEPRDEAANPATILDEMEKLATAGNAVSLQRLLRLKKLILPGSMGERFKVLIQTKK